MKDKECDETMVEAMAILLGADKDSVRGADLDLIETCEQVANDLACANTLCEEVQEALNGKPMQEFEESAEIARAVAALRAERDRLTEWCPGEPPPDPPHTRPIYLVAEVPPLGHGNPRVIGKGYREYQNGTEWFWTVNGSWGLRWQAAWRWVLMPPPPGRVGTNQTMSFSPGDDPATRRQMVAVIFLDIVTRFERGDLGEEAARYELAERIGWWKVKP